MLFLNMPFAYFTFYFYNYFLYSIFQFLMDYWFINEENFSIYFNFCILI